MISGGERAEPLACPGSCGSVRRRDDDELSGSLRVRAPLIGTVLKSLSGWRQAAARAWPLRSIFNQVVRRPNRRSAAKNDFNLCVSLGQGAARSPILCAQSTPGARHGLAHHRRATVRF